MARPRDTQRRKVYSAENECFGSHSTSVTDVDLREYAALTSYVEHVARSSWWKKRVPMLSWVRITVGDGRGRRGACASGSHEVIFPRGMRSDWVVLHELAHIAVYWQNGRSHKAVPWHGREFAREYLALVRRFLGVEAERALRSQFKAHGVRWRPATKRARASSGVI